MVELPSVTPTEGATYFNLLVTSGVGVVATLVLAEKLKNKTNVPVSSLILWGTVFTVITAAGVWNIYKSSK
jgi:aminoglycoside N3'-acetyltransferase